MVHAASGSITRQIESLFESGSLTGLTDRLLLERFSDRRDSAGEEAFSALVTRHGPMVLQTCRQIIGDLHLAEDAFQAVFLVLARKAPSIREPDLLSYWLHGVAFHTAQKARGRLVRQRKNEGNVPMKPLGLGVSSSETLEPVAQPVEEALLDRERAEALHYEIERLPRPFRLPVVLCYSEGLTLDEAARRLQWPPGTLRSRLARARDKLRRGLTRRGVVLSSMDLAVALRPKSALARISSHLCDTTTKAAIQFTAAQAVDNAITISATTLAQEILRSTLINRMRLVLLRLLVLSSAAMGAGYLTYSMAKKDEPRKLQVSQQQTSTKADAPTRATPGRMFVVGRVLDPQGKPVPNATVMAYAQLMSQSDHIIGHSQSNAFGEFRLDAMRTSSERNERVGAIALAPGYGAGWVELDPDAKQPKADISLQPEQVVQGRLFDLQGRPARDVTVSVNAISRILQPETNKRRDRSRRTRVRVERCECLVRLAQAGNHRCGRSVHYPWHCPRPTGLR